MVQAQVGEAAAAAAPAAPVDANITINSPELCPNASNFFTRGICEANICKERPDLAAHATCVKVREMEANRQ